MSAQIKALPSEAYVYVIGSHDGPQKIGMAIDPERRKVMFQRTNPFSLSVSFSVSVSRAECFLVERFVHYLLADFHARGEWFSVSPQEARAAVEEAVARVRAGEVAERISGSGRGRPILGDIASETIPTMVRLTKDVRARIAAVAGENKMAAFIREAVEGELQRREAAAGAVAPGTRKRSLRP